jgi:hypothetical protein
MVPHIKIASGVQRYPTWRAEPGVGSLDSSERCHIALSSARIHCDAILVGIGVWTHGGVAHVDVTGRVQSYANGSDEPAAAPLDNLERGHVAAGPRRIYADAVGLFVYHIQVAGRVQG